MSSNAGVVVVGAGLAGCEAAWQLAEMGIDVELFEMKPDLMSPAHSNADFAELVCSNSFRSDELSNAVGLLKEEMRRLGSLIIRCADATRVPAGGALAVDRALFSAMVTKAVNGHSRINVTRREITGIPGGADFRKGADNAEPAANLALTGDTDTPDILYAPDFRECKVIIASGPLTSDRLSEGIAALFPDRDVLSFFDSAAPIVTFESIDQGCSFFASRYGKGEASYINCPMSADEYKAFHTELCLAQEAPVHGFEDGLVFEGCLPIEVMARRGEDTMRYGPLKPVGLRDPATGKTPYAIVQLRKENVEGSLYNLVGFQTHLKFSEQKRVFSMIPALRSAVFVRYGVMHRNTYIDSPRLLDRYNRLRADPRLRFAGQITGVEGYVESAASGLLTGVETAREILSLPPADFPKETAIGALALYTSGGSVSDFQPMNVNFGIIEPCYAGVRGKRNRKLAVAERSLGIIDALLKEVIKFE